ncbi:beta-1,2-xylosyltransferase XYXT1 isoform X2 [Zea mays]|uniref:Glycosyltransferase 61 catalytic domain-containing protein n=1 Tax=Zea mays TaxID=4577 RepID=A0A804UFI8_MAIZE|nr:beta-1,2-xylosyltransferase XYXT1 isoform X2 [Zea mays]|eukprot:XP_020398914.1 uncharacterized protein LOC103634780 isoform X2 [Zea mays]
MEGGGKLVAYRYGGGVEPRKFGLGGLVAGLLLVTCAYYFSTVKLDAVRIVMSKQPMNPSEAFRSRAKNAAAGTVGSPANGGDSSKQTSESGGLQDQGAWSSKDGDGVSSSSFGQGESGRHLFGVSSFEEKQRDDAVHEKDDDDPRAGVAALPPLSSDIMQESGGGLEDLELQVQNAIAAAAAAAPPKESNSVSSNDPGSSSSEIFPSGPGPADQVPVPATSPEIEPLFANQIPAASSEVKAAPPFHLDPPVADAEAKQTAPLREWKPLCDLTSNRRIDWCELEGDVRVVGGSNGSVTLVAAPGADERSFHEESWSIKPYPRKADPNAMRSVRALAVRSVATAPPVACTDWHGVPALVFSARGYTGNYFHAYTDVILPLFLTARQYAGEVLLLVTGFQAWWVGKYLPVFRSLSNYEPVDLDRDRDPRVRCFRRVQVGLTSHDDFSIDPRRAPNGYSMLDFTRFMRATYGLPRDAVPRRGRGRPRPRLLVIARARTRRFLNAEDIVRGARKVGFEVVVSEVAQEVAAFAELVNTCDAVVGVHGAGLTNMVFLPPGGVVIQVLPLGPLEFVASYFRGPARDMGLSYLEYRISPEESTLLDQYPRDHPVLTDPMSVQAKDWVSFMGVYLFKQDVRLDMKRFRPVLKKALARLRAKPRNNNNK